MSKKGRRLLKAAALAGAAYAGAKNLGLLGKETTIPRMNNNDFEGVVTKKSKTVVPPKKPAVTKSVKPKKFLGMNFGVSQKPSNLEAFKEAEKNRRLKTGFGRNVGKKSTGYSGFGLGAMDGAKAGKFVTTKCKLGRNKKTKLS